MDKLEKRAGVAGVATAASLPLSQIDRDGFAIPAMRRTSSFQMATGGGSVGGDHSADPSSASSSPLSPSAQRRNRTAAAAAVGHVAAAKPAAMASRNGTALPGTARKPALGSAASFAGAAAALASSSDAGAPRLSSALTGMAAQAAPPVNPNMFLAAQRSGNGTADAATATAAAPKKKPVFSAQSRLNQDFLVLEEVWDAGVSAFR